MYMYMLMVIYAFLIRPLSQVCNTSTVLNMDSLSFRLISTLHQGLVLNVYYKHQSRMVALLLQPKS